MALDAREVADLNCLTRPARWPKTLEKRFFHSRHSLIELRVSREGRIRWPRCRLLAQTSTRCLRALAQTLEAEICK